MSGKPLAEAAKEAGLTTQSIAAVDAAGKDPSGAPVALPDGPELLKAAFASDVGLDEAPIQTKDRGFVWFAVTKVEPSHERAFEEAKPQVEAQWRAEQVDKALAAKADDLVKESAAGASVADVAKSVGATVEDGRRHPPRREDEPARVGGRGDLPRAGRRRRLGCDARRADRVQDHRRQDAAGRRRSIRASRRWPQQLDGATRESLIDQYIAALRRSLGVTVNPTVLQSAEGG